MKWYIGQPIVAIRNSDCGNIKKGQEYKIFGLRICPCKCGNYTQINVGVVWTGLLSGCCRCNTLEPPTAIYWKHECLFAPLDQDISELTQILEEPISIFERIRNTRPNLEE